jgi:imidazolonepropionase-like amidohydrolase
MKWRFCWAFLPFFGFVISLVAQNPELSKEVKQYVKVDAPKVVLLHVRVIDGTGSAAIEDQNVVIEGGKVTAIGRGAGVLTTNDRATFLDLNGYTVMPGIVGMHNHLYYQRRPNLKSDWSGEDPLVLPQISFSAPRLYLAGGVTTMRTTGSVEPYADLNLRRDIEAGKLPGPHIDVTGPYLEGATSPYIQMYRLKDADDARQLVNYWADRGATSFKAYTDITREELKAAIEVAHSRAIKVTGHLCSVTYPEAIELWIDDLEHGLFVDTQLDPDKKPDQCSESRGAYTLEHMTPESAQAKGLIALLVKRHVAITSTLPVFEGRTDLGKVPPVRQEMLDSMTSEARDDYFVLRNRPASAPALNFDSKSLYKNATALEVEFARAGGLLIAGPDPTGRGDVIPGFGDQREIELLVAEGFSPVEAIRIATLNGAIYLGRDRAIGSIALGKNADLVVIKGDPSKQISDVENVEIVFKDGVGYDSAKLRESVRGKYGQY